MAVFKQPPLVKNPYATQHGRRVLLSYIPYPFVNRSFPNYHPNIETSRTIGRVISQSGYDLDVYHCMVDEPIDYTQYDVLIGFGNPLENSYKGSYSGRRLLFAAEAYTEQRHVAELHRLRDLQRRQGVLLPPMRLKPYQDTCNALLSDAIICLGNAWTTSTYRGVFDGPIYRVPNHSHRFFSKADIPRQMDQAKRHFVWIGGSGAVLKGLDRCIEAFAQMPALTLHICGPIEKQLLALYADTLAQAPNIQQHGFVDISSAAFKTLVAQAAFMLYPTGSEGASTSVLDVMAGGMIPIMTEQSGVDGHDFALMLPDAQIDTLVAYCQEAAQKPVQELEQRAEAAYQFVHQHHQLSHFHAAFTQAWQHGVDGP
ncbi:glycosyltransferase [Magnetococcus sp. PR-3]|uniref:glycosyltransferase n=1 Tax=Magnetococcus sp. PR-3 TaxID=3120355 RepID=UPI002FCDF047